MSKIAEEEMRLSIREHPDVHPDILKIAIDMARERGGCTMPVGEYDITFARDRIAGEESEIGRLRRENATLRHALTIVRNHLGPEINPNNYDHDDVIALNDGCINAWNIASEALNPKEKPCEQAA